MLFPVRERSQIYQARHIVSGLARQLGMDETQTGQAAIVATEMATNLLKHARLGELSATIVNHRGAPALEILTVDDGPGMADVERCLSDGYSSTGTSGTGLGAVRRLAGCFAIHSLPGKGTVVMARLTGGGGAAKSWRGLDIGAAVAPFPGETVCGDAWGFLPRGAGGLLMVADGLGHGPEAALAAERAVKALAGGGDLTAARVAESAHRALTSTRGAAIGIADIQVERGQVAFVGIGNICGTVIAGGVSRAMVSHNGTAGMVARRFSEFVYPLAGPPAVVLHSDGVSARWRIEDYPGLLHQPASVIAGVIYRDFKRGRDDAAVVVAKVAP